MIQVDAINKQPVILFHYTRNNHGCIIYILYKAYKRHIYYIEINKGISI